MKIFEKLFGVKKKIDKEKVAESLKTTIEGLQCPAVRLKKTSAIKKSKFGGKPFVDTDNFEWPFSNGKPMVFLAQIDLSEIASVHHYDWLTDQGSILFFYDVIEMPWGFDPKDRGGWSVLYQSKQDGYVEHPLDIDDKYRIKEIFIEPLLVHVLPSYDDPSVELLALSDDESDVYFSLKNSNTKPLHQIGGFPSPIQNNNMELESQLASNGIYIGGSESYESEEAKAFKSGSQDWKLLFQFDSDADLDIMWGDCGMLYFWVQEQKSKVNQFDNSWLILQCY